MKTEKPYITKRRIIVERKYNPKFGDDKVCGCGHPYYRHFDTYDNMSPVGCKYCDCNIWHPIKNEEDKQQQEEQKGK